MQIVVYLSKLRSNIKKLRAATKNAFCAVLKADAYGHGLAIASYIHGSVDCFFTATAEEGVAVAALSSKPVLVMGGAICPVIAAKNYGLVPTVCSAAELCAVLSAGYKRFSVAVNTGMNRLGAGERELKAINAECVRKNVRPWSVYSHIYNGSSSAPAQSAEFDRLTAAPMLCARRHLYSSCALNMQGAGLYDMTRFGIAMYGYSPLTTPVMRVRARVVALRHVSRGEHVGYGSNVLDRDALIATVRCGYADGLRRCDGLTMRVRSQRCPVIATCMDVCMVDVTGTGCRVGEYAYLIWDKSDAEMLAERYGTNVYEVLTGFNGRAQRIYM